MPRSIRMPSLAELPDGPRRKFVVELFEYFRAARRPPLREISDRITANDELAGTASRETIRRMLSGAGVPARWDTVHAVFLVLCELANIKPEAPRWEDDRSGEWETRAQRMEEVWNEALDDVPSPLPQATDEPPF